MKKTKKSKNKRVNAKKRLKLAKKYFYELLSAYSTLKLVKIHKSGIGKKLAPWGGGAQILLCAPAGF